MTEKEHSNSFKAESISELGQPNAIPRGAEAARETTLPLADDASELAQIRAALGPSQPETLHNEPAEPSKAEINKVTNFLIKHPELLPAQIRVEMIRDLLRDNINDASITLKSDIQAAEKLNPSEAFITRVFVEQWLITRGYRMVEDKTISESIRTEREIESKKTNKSLFKRLAAAVAGVPEKTQTEIIERNLALAADNDALARDNERLKTANGRIKLENEAAVERAHERAEEILSVARDEGRKIIQESEKTADEKKIATEKKIEAILNKAEDQKKEWSNRIAGLQEETGKLSARKRIVEKEISTLESVKAGLLANPVLEAQYENRKEEKENSMKMLFEAILFYARRFGENETGISGSNKEIPQSIELLQSIFDSYDQMLRQAISYEEKYGTEQRALFFTSLFQQNKISGAQSLFATDERKQFSTLNFFDLGHFLQQFNGLTNKNADLKSMNEKNNRFFTRLRESLTGAKIYSSANENEFLRSLSERLSRV